MEPLWKGSELLHKLLADYLEGKISSALFCDNFETAFNFDIEKAELTPLEEAAFERLFNEVVCFSPFPEERAVIPSHRSEDQIMLAAKIASAEFGENS